MRTGGDQKRERRGESGWPCDRGDSRQREERVPQQILSRTGGAGSSTLCAVATACSAARSFVCCVLNGGGRREGGR